MTLRRLAVPAAVLVAAAGVGLPAVARADAAAPAAATAHYVGLVISGGNGGSYCVRWRSGITGDGVLNAVTTVHYRQDGIIDAIGGYPSPPHADSTHYWSYWHDAGGQWRYSSVGASSYLPPAGSVEGWSWDAGSGSAPQPSRRAAGLYASLCGARDAPSPTASPTGGTSGGPTSSHTTAPTRSSVAPTHHRTATARPSGAGTSAAGHGRPGTGSPPSTTSGHGGTTTTARGSGARSAAPGRHTSPVVRRSASSPPGASGRVSTGAPRASTATPPATPPATPAPTGPVPAASTSPTSGSALPLIGSLAAIGAVFGAAGLVARRRRTGS